MVEHFKEGKSFYNEGNYHQAIESFLEVVSENPQNHQGWNALGVTFSKFGLCWKADICFCNALASDPGNEIYLKNRSKNIKSQLEKGQAIVKMKKPLKQHQDDIMAALGVGILDAKKEVSSATTSAVRKSEIEFYREAKIGLYRWIAVVDNKTCKVCLGLNGRIYHEAFDERGMVNYDTAEFLRDEIANLAEQERIISSVDPKVSQIGPPLYDGCRCTFEQIRSFEQYMNTPIIVGQISPLPDYSKIEKKVTSKRKRIKKVESDNSNCI